MDADTKHMTAIIILILGSILGLFAVLGTIDQVETTAITSCKLSAIQAGTSVVEAILLCKK